jgi:hypothetical protein
LAGNGRIIDSILKEDCNNNKDFEACFVIAVTFFNIIYLLKNGGR